MTETVVYVLMYESPRSVHPRPEPIGEVVLDEQVAAWWINQAPNRTYVPCKIVDAPTWG